MTTLFIEPLGGLAGDMLLAALLDLKDPRFSLAELEGLADALVPGEARLALARVSRGSIEASLLEVHSPETHHAPHRHLSGLVELLERVELPPRARARALGVLTRIAEAEARVHGISVEEVHFHEVGAVDTLIDVCGVSLALELLEVEGVTSSVPITGEGTVRCAHGVMPVPVPAVVELLRGRELDLSGGPGERLTPTGAALLAELVEEFGAPGGFRTHSVGYGAGKRDPEHGPPNLVRVQLGTSRATAARREAWQLDVQLDDATGEELGLCVGALREAGALDVWTVAVQMKKDRPGVLLSALCRAERREALEAVVFENTQSLGLRWSRVERTECEREQLRVELDGREVRVKLRRRPPYPGASPLGERDLSPEFDDLAALSRESGATLRELERRAVALALEQLQSRSE